MTIKEAMEVIKEDALYNPESADLALKALDAVESIYDKCTNIHEYIGSVFKAENKREADILKDIHILVTDIQHKADIERK